MSEEPEQWFNNNAYKEGAIIVAQINVVYYATKRGVKLIKEYNSMITKDQNQYLLKIVKDYKIKFPDSQKSILQ